MTFEFALKLLPGLLAVLILIGVVFVEYTFGIDFSDSDRILNITQYVLTYIFLFYLILLPTVLISSASTKICYLISGVLFLLTLILSERRWNF